MKSHITEQFRDALAELPEQVQRQARASYKLFQQNPSHPSLRFKRIHSTRPIYSARITDEYRAVGVRDGDDITWFWIGSHAAYDHLVARLR